MPRILIDRLDDPLLDPYRHLKATNLTRWSDEFTAEGLLVVTRLLESRFEVLSVLATERREAEITPLVPAEIPLYVVPQTLAEELVGFDFHTGVLARGRRSLRPTLDEIVAGGGRRLTIAVCPNVNSPDNIGSIIRTCAALGVDALLMGRGCAPPFSRRVSRSSMGSVFRLPIIDTDDLPSALSNLRESHGFELVATVLDPDVEMLPDAPRRDRTAILFGNEMHGLDAEWIARCDRRVTMPMDSGTDSLNVSVAAGIVLHHFTRLAPPV
ncbi:MAG: TrmH family RNA methyltransferase [Planctomycetaceae bacterium]